MNTRDPHITPIPSGYPNCCHFGASGSGQQYVYTTCTYDQETIIIIMNQNMFRSEIMARGPKVTSIKHNKLQQCQKALITDTRNHALTILYLLHEQSHPIPTIPFSLQRGNYSHMDGGIMDG